jgi:hypothetical protein
MVGSHSLWLATLLMLAWSMPAGAEGRDRCGHRAVPCCACRRGGWHAVAHAGAGDGTLLRITEQRWFVREHRRITAATWARPDIKARSNCAACHPAAERGLYEDEK